MTAIYSQLWTSNVDNYQYVQLVDHPFRFYSSVLDKLGFKAACEIPIGFFFDFESIPIVKGKDKRAGAIHDYFSRIDSDPVLNKGLTAELYLEFLEYCSAIDLERMKKENHPYVPEALIPIYVPISEWIHHHIKWAVVRAWPGYFHKFSVKATGKEIAGLDSDPYVTEEKIEALIVKTEEVSKDLKDVDIPQPQVDAMVDKVDSVTEKLEEKLEEISKL